jgi:hypothetical protein
MRFRDIFNEVSEVRRKNQLKESKHSLIDMLSLMFNVIQKFATDGKVSRKNDAEKIDVLKNMISDMMNDSDQKKIIRGDG